jgi:hypothetical protein
LEPATTVVFSYKPQSNMAASLDFRQKGKIPKKFCPKLARDDL